MRATLSEMAVEEAIVASEMLQVSPGVHSAIVELLGADIPITTVSHADFKVHTATSRGVVRTGEFTPYANVILVAGVIFQGHNCG